MVTYTPRRQPSTLQRTSATQMCRRCQVFFWGGRVHKPSGTVRCVRHVPGASLDGVVIAEFLQVVSELIWGGEDFGSGGARRNLGACWQRVTPAGHGHADDHTQTRNQYKICRTLHYSCNTQYAVIHLGIIFDICII
jgi:hypothetical protein